MYKLFALFTRTCGNCEMYRCRSLPPSSITQRKASHLIPDPLSSPDAITPAGTKEELGSSGPTPLVARSEGGQLGSSADYLHPHNGLSGLAVRLECEVVRPFQNSVEVLVAPCPETEIGVRDGFEVWELECCSEVHLG